MKNSLILLLVVAFISLSCKRSHNSKDSLINSIESLKNKGFIGEVTYIPNTYSEVATDTIFNNGFKINIRHYSDMNNEVLNEFKRDTITHQHFYRDFKANVKVSKNDVTLFSKTIDKSFFINAKSVDNSFFEAGILKDIWVEEFSTSTTQNAVINFNFCQPKTKDCKTFKVTFFENKRFLIELIPE